jgi:PadR family transcriptional regulator, regulatory protein PadR
MFFVDIQQETQYTLVDSQKEGLLGESKTDILQGTLDLLVLKTLDAMGPMHGWAIAKRIEQVSDDALAVNQGTLYPALLRLQQKGWISAKWGTSDNNRRAKFYSLTRKGQKQVAQEERNWEQMVSIVGRVLRSAED